VTIKNYGVVFDEIQTALATYRPGTAIKSELFKPEVAKHRAKARRPDSVRVRRGEPRFAEPSWVAGEACFRIFVY